MVLNISNCNRNVAILVKMRGLKMSGDIPFTEIWDVGVLSQFQPVTPVFSYNWQFFWRDNEVSNVQYFKLQ